MRDGSCPLDRKVWLIGRDPSACLVVDDETVSRAHARIAVGPHGGHYIEDLASTNGTFVNGRRVSRAPLRGPASIRLGSEFEMRFTPGETTETAPSLTPAREQGPDSRRGASSLPSLSPAAVEPPVTSALQGLLMIELEDVEELEAHDGRSASNRARQAVADIVARAVSPGNVVTRLGGSELVVLVAGAGALPLTGLASRIRSAVARHVFRPTPLVLRLR